MNVGMVLQKNPEFIARKVADGRYFFLNLNPQPSPDLVVVGGGYERCLPGYKVTRADFPFMSIEYVLTGRGTFTCGGQTSKLSAGSVYLYGPGVAHDIESDPEDGLVKYFFDFSGDRGLALLNETPLKLGSCSQVSTPIKFMELCEDLLADGSLETSFNRRVCSVSLELLILKASENLRSSDSRQSRAYSTYLRCRQCLEDNFLECRTLDELANLCFIEKPYLCRLFQRFDGDTPYQRLIRLRMSHAVVLLQSGDRLIKEVADLLDYDDPYHFSRVFKKVYGVSPQNFMNSNVRLG